LVGATAIHNQYFQDRSPVVLGLYKQIIKAGAYTVLFIPYRNND
jgi:hypothetical protein